MTERMQDRALQCEAFTADVGAGLRTVKLAGWGSVQSTHGTFIVDEVAAQQTIAAFDAQGVELPVDIEHSVLNESLPPEQRSAIGWLTKIFAESGKGLFALVKWSEKAVGLIRSGAFQYLSPVFQINKADRRIVGIHSAAVTTKPALVNADLLAASQNTNADAGHTVDMGGIADLLGVELIHGGAATLPARCHAKLKALLADDAVAIAASVRERLGLPATANRDAVLLAMTVVGADDKAATELAAMREAESQRTATAMVQGFIGAGKLNPNDKPAVEAATRLAMSDPGTLEAIFKNMVPQCPPGRTNPPSSRQMTIIGAEREFKGNPAHARSTSLQAFVANALREKGLPKLTEAETSELAVV